jgi:hypothetical protein
VIIGNTRRYANMVEMTTDASINDGMLDACVITAGNPLSTMQQIASLLFRHKPDNQTAQFFRGARLSIRVPASIALQLDGSAVKLKDYLRKTDRKAMQRAEDAERILVTYQFDAIPGVLRVAIPRTYDDALFEGSHHERTPLPPEQEETMSDASRQPGMSSAGEQPSHEQLDTLLELGRKVTVVGVTPHADEKHMYIVAGTTSKAGIGETRPVAICIDNGTMLQKRTGEPVAIVEVEHLQENAEIVVVGKKSKRGVIHATHVVV